MWTADAGVPRQQKHPLSAAVSACYTPSSHSLFQPLLLKFMLLKSLTMLVFWPAGALAGRGGGGCPRRCAHRPALSPGRAVQRGSLQIHVAGSGDHAGR